MPVAAPPDNALLSVSWLDYYRHNRESLLPMPWERGADLNEAELAAVASSIQEFQLGESSEGKHLVRRAEEFGRREGLSGWGKRFAPGIISVARPFFDCFGVGGACDKIGSP